MSESGHYEHLKVNSIILETICQLIQITFNYKSQLLIWLYGKYNINIFLLYCSIYLQIVDNVLPSSQNVSISKNFI